MYPKEDLDLSKYWNSICYSGVGGIWTLLVRGVRYHNVRHNVRDSRDWLAIGTSELDWEETLRVRYDYDVTLTIDRDDAANC